jgi:transcription-repair coupling factor (superfamily II helicase)
MSTLATPPEERHPVLTFVGAYDEKQIAAAVRRELLREGQVFYVHNKVQSIEKAAARLRELVPEARIATAHGKMSEGRLEQVVLDFWEKRFDVLVCTTIVETGLDISNANTLIVERADLLGLSQLHQLRGRVGRGRERAYAYFLFPPEKPLTETAHDRLADDRQPHRARRRHAGGDEGPGDPRCRQLCSAASSPGTSRGSASTSTCGWSARRSRHTRGRRRPHPRR